MTLPLPFNDSPEPAPLSGQFGDLPLLAKRQKVVLVMDLVESVRLMASNEATLVNQWRGFVQHAQTQVLPQFHGRLVKSLGDGIMAEFNGATEAVHAALALQRHFDPLNRQNKPHEHLFLRAGLNSCEVYSDELDIYGAGVNLAARVTTLAGPGETMVTATVRDELVDGLDADVHDMGDCYLKHVEKPVRVFRVEQAGLPAVANKHKPQAQAIQPTIAVIPFESRHQDVGSHAFGDLVADGVIAQLSRTSALNVISRLSTAAFHKRHLASTELERHLKADYSVSGSYVVSGSAVLITAEVCNSQTGNLIWTDRFTVPTYDLLQVQSKACQHIAEATHQALIATSVQEAQTAPMPSIASHSLLLAGVQLMHRSSAEDFARSHAALDALSERHPRSAACRAWLAKWYVLNTTRGLSKTPEREASIALAHTQRALDLEPENSMAMAMQGFVKLHLFKDMAGAGGVLQRAVAANPNDPLAWLFNGVLHAFQDEPQAALACSLKAMSLSPMDPIRYYFESLAASSAICAGQPTLAIQWATQSIRRNAFHAHTHRALITAYWLADQPESARNAARKLLTLSPGTTVDKFLRNSVSADLRFGQQMAAALRDSGIPAN